MWSSTFGLFMIYLIRVAGAGHRNRAEVVLQTVVGFQGNGRARGLLVEAGVKAATLDHEVIDYAVKDGAIVVFVLHVVQKVFNRLGRLVGIKFKHKVPCCGDKLDPRGLLRQCTLSATKHIDRKSTR